MFVFGGLVTRFVMGVVVLAVAAGAAWWFFIREDNEAQKEAAPITDEVRDAAASPSAAAAGSPAANATTGSPTPATTAPNSAVGEGASSIGEQGYRIIEGQSEAWYLAPEKLASLPTTSVAKGTTKDVSGEFHFTHEGLNPDRPTVFTVGLTSFDSGESRRDNRAAGALEVNQYPEATFTAASLAGMPAEFGTEDTVMQLTGMLDLHGVEKEVTWELKVKKDGASGILSGLATLEIAYADFNIRKPDIANFVTVDENLTLQVQLFAAPE